VIPYPQALKALPSTPGGYSLRVEPGHPAFDGHFPGQPILSGLIQVDWAARLGQDTFGPLGIFQCVEHLKFQAPIRPDEPLELHLDWTPEARQLRFRYTGSQGPKSAGILIFTPAP
jgi:3-hydroxymyristoyl/3-hydroxydecanoyl-(acyl carrier protein) dehydratase